MTLRHFGVLLLVFTFSFLAAARLVSFFALRYWRMRAVAAEELLSLSWHRDFMLTRLELDQSEAEQLLDRKLVRIAELKTEIDAIQMVIGLLEYEASAIHS